MNRLIVSNENHKKVMAEKYRAFFEERVYQEYFISCCDKVSLKTNPVPMVEFVTKDDDGNYIREDVSAMWFGFCIGLEPKP